MLGLTLESIVSSKWHFSDGIKKCVIKYLLQDYVGTYLEKPIIMDQLSVDIAQGTGSVCELSLAVDTLNEKADTLNLPFIFLEGYIGEISISIPWNSLSKENCFIEISGLILTLSPKERLEEISVVDSMMDSMTSSMQIAQECINQLGVDSKELYKTPKDSKQGRSVEGVEQFAHVIDSIFNRTKLRFVDSIIRVEHTSSTSNVGLAFEVHIKNLDYFDESGLEKESPPSEEKEAQPSEKNESPTSKKKESLPSDKKESLPSDKKESPPSEEEESQPSDKKKSKSNKTEFESQHYLSKKFLIEGLSFYIEEFLLSGHNCSNSSTMSNGTESMYRSPPVLIDNNKLIENNLSSDYHAESCNGPIIFCKFNGLQEIRINLKQSEETDGPKFNFEINWGGLVMFVSPRQVHEIIELMECIFSPEQAEKPLSNSSGNGNKLCPRPMNLGDYNRVEKELINNMKPPNENYIMNSPNGWSSPLGEEIEEEFYPTGSHVLVKNMTNSHLSGYSDMQTSNVSNMMSTSTHPKIKNSKSANKSTEKFLLSFKLKLSSVILVLLHDDVLVLSDNNSSISQASSIDLMTKAENFFSKVGTLSLTQHTQKEFTAAHNRLISACPLSHFSFLAYNISIGGSQEIIGKTQVFCTSLTSTLMELKEYVASPNGGMDLWNLLSFKESFTSKDKISSSAKRRVTLSFEQVKNLSTTPKRPRRPKIKFKALLEDCLVDIDISIIDRISPLLNRKTILIKAEEPFSPDLPPSHLDNQAFLDMIYDNPVKSDYTMDILCNITCLDLRIRFPIPDLRPVSDMNRIPWWKKNIRGDVLTFKFEDFYFETTLDSLSSHKAYEVKCKDISVLFQEKEGNVPIPILRASVQEGVQRGFDPVRLLLHCDAVKPWKDLEDNFNDADLMTKSMSGFLEDLYEKKPSPFVVRKIASQQKKNTIDELTSPASKREIFRFIDDTLESVQYQLDICLPKVQGFLPSKYICEVLYNRLVTDLLLWQPSAPNQTQCLNPNMQGLVGGLDVMSTFNKEANSIFHKMKIEFEVDSETSSYHSVYEPKHKIHKKASIDDLDCPTLFATMVKVGNLEVLLHTPYRDADDKVLPGRHGEIMIHMTDACLFAAAGYKGKYDLSYICALANEASVYHKSNNVTPSVPVVNLGSSFSSRCMNKVLYRSDSVIKLRSGIKEEKYANEVFSMTVKMDFDTIKNMNTILFAGGLQSMTLRHFMTKSSESWLTQLSDMFNVDDYPIAGYEIPNVVTELNFQAQCCAIDYQPLNLPFRSIVTIDSFSITSNISISCEVSILYFILEDAALFLTQDTNAKKVNLLNSVCVADLDVFEFCLKLVENGTRPPFQELIISSNIIHIRTCADSCRALLELLIYIASDGDLVQEPLETDVAVNCGDTVLQPKESEESVYSPLIGKYSEQQFVETMIAEAMEDSQPRKRTNEINIKEKGVEVFFFPDENTKHKLTQNQLLNRSRLEDSYMFKDTVFALTDALKEETTVNSFEADPSSDEEFCILECSPGTGIKYKIGDYQARKSDLDVRANDGDEHYFTRPQLVSNKLAAAENIQNPVLKYLLQDLTFVWHLYGGNDFCDSKAKTSKVQINDTNGNIRMFPSESLNEPYKISSVSYCNDDSKSSPSLQIKRSNTHWYTIGGPKRCRATLMEIQLTKVQFQYEVYPDDVDDTCRHILLINDIEIRDRLSTSKLNKFFYQYSSESCPRQSHSNMVEIRALTGKRDPYSVTEEMSLNVSVRPIRLNIDQDALLFLCKFFQTLLMSEKLSEFGEEERPQTPKVAHVPVMNVNIDKISQFQNENQLLVDFENCLENAEGNMKNSNANRDLPIYIKNFRFSPRVPIKIDYHGKHIDINSQYGALAGLIIGLGQLNNSEIVLNRLVYQQGVLGFSKLMNLVINEWVCDVKRNQLPSILGGIGPMHTFIKLFGGIKDLIWIPIEHYQNNGRVLRGIQKGASAFTSSSVHAALDLTGRFVSCIQSTAETMYDMVSSGPSVRNQAYRRGSNHPQDIREGVTAAYDLMKNGLGDTTTALVQVASKELRTRGMPGAFGEVIRQIPPTVVQPIILASEATCTVLGGMKNQLDPDARREAADKWKPT